MTAYLRTPLVLPAAAIITVALFLLMRSLIDIGPVPLIETDERVPVEMNVEVDPVEPRTGREFEIVDPVDPPPPVETSEVDRAVPDPVSPAENFTTPPIDDPVLEEFSGRIPVDGDPTPTVRVSPVYPTVLADRGVEGQCTMMFDIMPNGRTSNVRALDCTNRGFERASIRAVQNWRYDPQVRNGEPVIYRGATTQLIYELGD
ncbi:TonB family protein [Maricaulis sp.]|uniref:energy transducer TonB n=1 Tax=Maricaulis sp. TaxID=1486257 RepID=UPI002623E86B|nr:TonB family protein [Maricaulis sp.]